jgi:hypothetical protein
MVLVSSTRLFWHRLALPFSKNFGDVKLRSKTVEQERVGSAEFVKQELVDLLVRNNLHYRSDIYVDNQHYKNERIGSNGQSCGQSKTVELILE